ncbi:hypothetical protein [Streptomyces sp. H34-S4]|uniref:hypothetical protein n=1 Tax=Streptomyces sp. H34-S4 TaxID=2996463 RepID=UPI0022720A58|nr:hypothetical protein [Streptomyces sp. H34-S4]MCY0934754.1 hypothetical protein [Streptomyces sp. H34-S4]
MDGNEAIAGGGLAEGRRAFTEVLARLVEATGAGSQADVVRALASRGYPVDRGALSRYLSGARSPALQFVEQLYRLAVLQVGSAEGLGLTWEDVRRAHGRVELRKAAKCSDCVRGRGGEAGSDAAADVGQAGSGEVISAARHRVASPPVPRRRGDRRRSDSDLAAAERFAAGAADLDRDGRASEAVAALSDAVAFFTPLEAAAAIVALGGGRHDQLADSLGQMYARERQGRAVIRMVLELQDRGVPDQAAAVLRMAAEVGGPD